MSSRHISSRSSLISLPIGNDNTVGTSCDSCRARYSGTFPGNFKLSKPIMQCLVVVLFFLAAAASGKQTLIQPINLTLCNESSQNVTRFMTDVFVVQPQQHESCSITNTSTPVVSYFDSFGNIALCITTSTCIYDRNSQ